MYIFSILRIYFKLVNNISLKLNYFMHACIFICIYMYEFNLFTDLKNDKGKFIIWKLSLIG